MKKESFEFRFILLLLFILFFCSELKSQTFPSQSLIQIKRIITFPISCPAPQYIIEIRNDRSISFYNNLPIEVFLNHPAGLDKWGVDSTIIQLDSVDFKLLEEVINEINLETINKIEKPESKTGIECWISGGNTVDFIIEFTNQRVEFGIGSNNENYISESARIIRNLVEELEEKYKPKK